MGNLLAAITNDGKTDIVTQYQYDTANRITKMITGLSAYSANPTDGAATRYSYNNLGYLYSTTDPMGETERYDSYDYTGNVLSVTDKNGNTMHNEYGPYGLVKSYFDDLPETKEYIYNKLGQLVAEKSINANEQAVEESYEYDVFGRMVKSVANDGSVQNYTYDGNSNITSYELTKDDVVKNTVDYAYNNLNQLTALSNNGIMTSYTYDANGNLKKKSLNSGVTTDYTYNKAGLMTYMKTKKGGNAYTDYDCRYLLNGLLSAVYMPYEGDPTANEHKIKHYTYDNAGRLTADGVVNGASQPHANTYQYDLRGNRVSQTSGIPDDLISTQTDYEYDLNNQLLNESSHTQDEYHNTHSYSSARYYYDDNGNMTAKQTSTKGSLPATRSSRMALSGRSSDTGLEIYRYDAFNRLTNYNSGSDEASYTYSANNLRASKTVNRERTNFVWNGQNLAAESKKNGINTYTYDITGVHIANQNGTVTSYLKDYHGNVIGKTTKTGAMFNEMGTTTDYDAFGNRWQGDAPDPFGYCGEYLDNESGLIYLRNRYYDSTSGRFITEDPIKYDLNWYSYCGGNPVNFVDPMGLCEKCFENYENYQNFCKQEDIAFENEIKRNTDSSDAINIVQNGAIINIYAYVSIGKSALSKENIVDSTMEGSNITYRQAVLNGIRNGWGGTYWDENGAPLTVVVNILDLGDRKTHNIRCNQEVIPISLSPLSEEYNFGYGVSTAWTIWRDSKVKRIGINCGAYDIDSLPMVAAHEFGHALGLDDVYELPESEQFLSIMRFQWEVNGNAQQVDYAMVIRNKTYSYKDVKIHSPNIIKQYAEFVN